MSEGEKNGRIFVCRFYNNIFYVDFAIDIEDNRKYYEWLLGDLEKYKRKKNERGGGKLEDLERIEKSAEGGE
jgi:hypothetical protein